MNRLLSWILCAVFAALTGVLSQIQIPLPFTPVPINLALLPVFICGGALGAKRGAVSMVIYILLGAVGAPVFVGFSGGVGALAGPTGGYILGYLPAAVIMGWFASKGANAETARKPALGGTLRGGRGVLISLAKGVPALAACYALGTGWFMLSQGMGLWQSLVMCVIPFVPGDVLKIIAASVVIEALRNPLRAIAASRNGGL